MRRWGLAGVAALVGLTGCCLCGSSEGDRAYAGHHPSGTAYVECRPSAGAGDCEQRFRAICNGDYDEVPPDHVRDFDRTADDQTRIAFCRD